MDILGFLRKEHEEIEMELGELDFITKGNEINYSNLVHTYWKVCGLWDSHEKKEAGIFPIMKKEGFEVPIDFLFLEHEELRNRTNKINAAINSGNDAKVKEALAKEMRDFIHLMRKHMKEEEKTLDGVITSGLSEEAKETIRAVILRAKK